MIGKSWASEWHCGEFYIAFMLIVLTCLSCATMKRNNLREPMQKVDEKYAAYLGSFDSIQLLDQLLLGMEPGELWADGARKKDAMAIVESESLGDKLRFHALLTILMRDSVAAQEILPHTRATILCAAIAGDFLEYDEHWGRLWQGGSIGILGGMVVECGESAISPLKGLLENNTPKSSYLGSEEATEMAIRHYRLKDFAAYYIAKIRAYELPWQPVLGDRDAAIEAMRKALGL
jgi:hypothetical protein